MNLFLKKYDFYPNKKEIGLNIKRYLKTFKILDQKMDDGNYLDGNIRSYCSEKGCSKLFIMLTNNS